MILINNDCSENDNNDCSENYNDNDNSNGNYNEKLNIELTVKKIVYYHCCIFGQEIQQGLFKLRHQYVGKEFLQYLTKYEIPHKIDDHFFTINIQIEDF